MAATAKKAWHDRLGDQRNKRNTGHHTEDEQGFKWRVGLNAFGSLASQTTVGHGGGRHDWHRHNVCCLNYTAPMAGLRQETFVIYEKVGNFVGGLFSNNPVVLSLSSSADSQSSPANVFQVEVFDSKPLTSCWIWSEVAGYFPFTIFTMTKISSFLHYLHTNKKRKKLVRQKVGSSLPCKFFGYVGYPFLCSERWKLLARLHPAICSTLNSPS